MAEEVTVIRHAAEELAATLPPLLVAAERIAATVSAGIHGRRRVGPGESFWQFRRYLPGDPVQSIDWRQSAKSDPVFVREHEWAAAQSIWLWLDRSPSMDYRSERSLPTKKERSMLLVLALAALLVRGGEKVALLDDTEPPAMGRAILARLAATLAARPPAAESLPSRTRFPRHAQVVLVGDFLAPLEDIDARLRDVAGRGVQGHLLQVLDPVEEAPPFAGRIRFSGLEGEPDHLVTRAEDLRDEYMARLRRHREAIAAITTRIGWSFGLHHTDGSPQTALLALHAMISGR